MAATATERLALGTTVRLRRGAEMPLFGLGTWLSEGDGTCRKAVQLAIESGYRLIDTATMYDNEADVGAALKESGKASGSEIFIVSKLATTDHGRDAALAAIDRTLSALGVQQLQLWLMHSPTGGRVVETWKAMIEAREAGKCASIGVSNCGPAQLEALKAAGCELPEVNQFELHVWNQQREAVDYCRANGIVVMSYCPLARCKLFGQTGLAKLAERKGCSEAQLCVRWLLGRGFVTMYARAPTIERASPHAAALTPVTPMLARAIARPKSSNAERIAENGAALAIELSVEEMAELDALEQGFFASNAVKAMWKPWDEVA